jgi:hypothetical protein
MWEFCIPSNYIFCAVNFTTVALLSLIISCKLLFQFVNSLSDFHWKHTTKLLVLYNHTAFYQQQTLSSFDSSMYEKVPK